MGWRTSASLSNWTGGHRDLVRIEVGLDSRCLCLLCCSYVQSACKIFKAAEECRLDRDEEKAYVLYMKYLTVYDIIKKRPDFKQHPV